MKALIFLLIIIFCSCNMNNNKKMEKTVIYSELNKSFEDTLRVDATSTKITGMKLVITGNLTGKGKLYYSHVPFIRKQFIELEGTIDEKIETDWYDERCLIIYEPDDTFTKGEIIVVFKTY